MFTGMGFYGCKKGTGDPMLSLHTRKGRLTADWAISSSTDTYTFGGQTQITTWTANTVTQTDPTGSTVGTAARYNLSIIKDGTWKLDEGYTESGTPATIYSVTQNGTWNWEGKVGDDKNKDRIVLRTLMDSQTISGSTSSTTVKTYTGDLAPAQIFYIETLKSKELTMTWTGTSTSGSSSTNETGTMTFTKSK